MTKRERNLILVIGKAARTVFVDGLSDEPTGWRLSHGRTSDLSLLRVGTLLWHDFRELTPSLLKSKNIYLKSILLLI